MSADNLHYIRQRDGKWQVYLNLSASCETLPQLQRKPDAAFDTVEEALRWAGDDAQGYTEYGTVVEPRTVVKSDPDVAWSNDDQPTMTCPRCKAELPDYDGVGVLAHIKPVYADGCGYCRHASRDDGVCNYCGDGNVIGSARYATTPVLLDLAHQYVRNIGDDDTNDFQNVKLLAQGVIDYAADNAGLRTRQQELLETIVRITEYVTEYERRQAALDAQLRDLVLRFCRVPLLNGGFVAVVESGRTPITRAELATANELLRALEGELRILTTANQYLRANAMTSGELDHQKELEKQVAEAKANEEEAWARRRLYFSERNEAGGRLLKRALEAAGSFLVARTNRWDDGVAEEIAAGNAELDAIRAEAAQYSWWKP